MAYTRKATSSNYVNQRYLNEGCALSLAFETISGRWTSQILFCVYFGRNRFALIKKELPRISDQILGLRLKQLLEHKLITKKKSELEFHYELTSKGEKLIQLLDDLTEWYKKA